MGFPLANEREEEGGGGGGERRGIRLHYLQPPHVIYDREGSLIKTLKSQHIFTKKKPGHLRVGRVCILMKARAQRGRLAQAHLFFQYHIKVGPRFEPATTMNEKHSIETSLARASQTIEVANIPHC